MYRTQWDLLSQVDSFVRDVQNLLGVQAPAGALGFERAGDFVPSVLGVRAAPRLNVDDAGDHFVVEASVPGVEPGDLDITVLGDELTVSGAWSRESEAGDGDGAARVHRRERQRGQFSRTITLPSDIDPDRVEASYDNGILKLKLTKIAAAQPRRIQLSVN